MRKQKSMGNKGFSLVELIIVIAIMAILVGVMAPQLLKYVERSKESADRQVADTVRTAVVTALLDPVVDDGPVGAQSYENLTKVYEVGTNFGAAVKATLNGEAATAVEAKLTSKAYKNQKIKVTITADSKVTVTVDANTGSGAGPIKIE